MNMYKKILSILLIAVISTFTSCDEPTYSMDAILFLYSEDAIVEVSYYEGHGNGVYIQETTTVELSNEIKWVGGTVDVLVSRFNKHPQYGIMTIQIKEGEGPVIATPFDRLYVNGKISVISGDSTYSEKEILEELAKNEGYAVKIADKEVHSVPGKCAWDYSKCEMVDYGHGNYPAIEL